MERYTLEWLFSYTQEVNGCLVWKRAVDKDGYAQSGPLSRKFKVHREVMRLLGHDILNLCVMHRCDNPSCINPDHLVVGTSAQNNSDRAIKGRSHIGEWRPLVPEVKRLIYLGLRNKDISEQLGINCRRVSEIRHNKLFDIKVGV